MLVIVIVSLKMKVLVVSIGCHPPDEVVEDDCRNDERDQWNGHAEHEERSDEVEHRPSPVLVTG